MCLDFLPPHPIAFNKTMKDKVCKIRSQAQKKKRWVLST